MWAWLSAWRHRAPLHAPAAEPLPDALWQPLVDALPFLSDLDTGDRHHLRGLAANFLAQKEFHGAGGLVITDAMALSIATQACLPLLHLHAPPGGSLRDPLAWYADFVGIVVHPGEVLARREIVDDTGVVHHYNEVLSGEAMAGGPVMLSWDEVARAGESAAQGTNVVIHEFVHKLAMQGGMVENGSGDCPPLPPGFMGTASPRAAVQAWFGVLQPEYEAFREKVIIAERFGGAETWLDPYGAESIDEFFPVACEAYFVNRDRFGQEFPKLLALFNNFFHPANRPA